MAEDVETLDTLTAADEALLHGEPETTDGSPEPTPDVEVPTSTEPTPDGPARDEKGRFASSAPSPEAKEPDGAEIPGQPAAPEPEPEPWKFAAEGADFTLDGALRKPDGIYIPSQHSERTEKLIRQGLAWEGSGQRYVTELSNRHQQAEQRASAAEARVQAAEAQSQTVLGHFENLIAQSQPLMAAGAAMQDTPIGQWLAQAAMNWPILVAESKARAVELKAEADRKQLQEIRDREQQAQMRPLMESRVKEFCEYHGKLNGLDAETIADMVEEFKHPRYESLLFVKAPHDDLQNGIQKGQLALDHSVIEDRAKRLAKYVKPKARAVSAPAKPVAPTVKPKVPPTVSATRNPAPQKSTRKPTNKQEADDWLLYGEPD